MHLAVLRQKIHGQSATDLATVLRTRFPEHTVTLAETAAAERSALQRADVAIGEGTSLQERLDDAPNLQLFACVYAGTSHLDLERFREAGVPVTNAAGVHGPNIGEYVIGALISMVRDFRRATRQQDRHEWAAYPCGELAGSTVTVVGLGAIGQAVVARLDPFGVRTIGVRYTPSKGGPTDSVVGFDGLEAVLPETEHLVLACPLTETTRGLIGTGELQTLPTDATIVNVARGGVIETDALLRALRWNWIDGAFLDVTDPEPLPPDHPLWEFEDVHITPHNAGSTPAYYDRFADILAGNLEWLADSEGATEPRNRVA